MRIGQQLEVIDFPQNFALEWQVGIYEILQAWASESSELYFKAFSTFFVILQITDDFNILMSDLHCT